MIFCLISRFVLYHHIYTGKKFAKDGAFKSVAFFRVLMVQFFYPKVCHQCFSCQGRNGMPKFGIHSTWVAVDMSSRLYILMDGLSFDPKFQSTCSTWLVPNMFYFHLLLGEMIQFDEQIFQMGWFNHQLSNEKKPVWLG